MSKRYQARDREFRYMDEMERRRLRDLIRRGAYRVPSEDVAEAILPFLVKLR
jgi:anti-sigma28 factor (negative regulator of flagellin synthesis)